jgi:NADH-quinone oxidoreductase subunit M
MPLFAGIFLCFVDRTKIFFIRNFSLFFSLFILNICFSFVLFFDPTVSTFQFLEKYNWFDSINVNVVLGLDGLALLMIQLTALLIPTCIILC